MVYRDETRRAVDREALKSIGVMVTALMLIIALGFFLDRLRFVLIAVAFPFLFGLGNVSGKRSNAIRHHELLRIYGGRSYLEALQAEIIKNGISKMMDDYWFQEQAKLRGVKHSIFDDF